MCNRVEVDVSSIIVEKRKFSKCRSKFRVEREKDWRDVRSHRENGGAPGIWAAGEKDQALHPRPCLNLFRFSRGAAVTGASPRAFLLEFFTDDPLLLPLLRILVARSCVKVLPLSFQLASYLKNLRASKETGRFLLSLSSW